MKTLANLLAHGLISLDVYQKAKMDKTLSGQPIIPGKTYTVDHHVTAFKVVVRHMSTVTADTIKNILQQRLEVVSCEAVDGNTYFI